MWYLTIPKVIKCFETCSAVYKIQAFTICWLQQQNQITAKEIQLDSNQEDIKYLVGFYLPETGKLADEHVLLSVLNSSSQVNVFKSTM